MPASSTNIATLSHSMASRHDPFTKGSQVCDSVVEMPCQSRSLIGIHHAKPCSQASTVDGVHLRMDEWVISVDRLNKKRLAECAQVTGLAIRQTCPCQTWLCRRLTIDTFTINALTGVDLKLTTGALSPALAVGVGEAAIRMRSLLTDSTIARVDGAIVTIVTVCVRAAAARNRLRHALTSLGIARVRSAVVTVVAVEVLAAAARNRLPRTDIVCATDVLGARLPVVAVGRRVAALGISHLHTDSFCARVERALHAVSAVCLVLALGLTVGALLVALTSETRKRVRVVLAIAPAGAVSTDVSRDLPIRALRLR